MTLLTKGYNIIKKLSGSSYLLEIDKLTEEYDNLIIILDQLRIILMQQHIEKRIMPVEKK